MPSMKFDNAFSKEVRMQRREGPKSRIPSREERRGTGSKVTSQRAGAMIKGTKLCSG